MKVSISFMRNLFQHLLYIAIMFVASIAISASSFARPVSYPEGWTIMQMNNTNSNNLHVHYSPTAKYSIGYKGEYHRAEEWQFHGMQLNYLAKRVNKKSSQANIYLKSAIGAAYSDFGAFDNKTEAAASIGIATDWETRRYFTSYENRLTYAGDIEKSFEQKARVGIAPYLGSYGDLHTWLMLEVDHSPKRADEVIYTPMVRLFKDVYLFEFGVSSNKDFLINTVIRF
ncbi:MAG: hypothetical protein PQ612_07085 [Rickettsiales bacterium]|nr:hypothetical protein [Pseudomonadota bacterium]MDA0965770.1 hypothetical protein [Pseudomonadota bacterium]MDG4543768.1 hypothetical protein [Rickettsiales bacterium]MDG4545915.1 hypothetical protein [Rickettsiales bacterium]MDG4548161.1 hypothetical protein [Rickettsiales bacterium]